jgi:type IV secretion system protein VirB5
MKNTLKKITVSLAVVSMLSTQLYSFSIFGTSIDAATLPAQLKQLDEMIKQVTALKKQVAAQTGIRDIITSSQEMMQLMKFMDDHSLDFMDLTNDIIDHPRSQIGLYAKKLFEHYNLFNDCNYDYMNDNQKRICKSEMVRNVQEIATFQHTTKHLKKVMQNLKQLSQKRQNSKSVKESADIANAIQIQLAELEMMKTQVDMMIAQNRSKARVDRRQSEQIMRSKRYKYTNWGN